jgi:hypothetical protein
MLPGNADVDFTLKVQEGRFRLMYQWERREGGEKQKRRQRMDEG